jgi:hypothetical protein
MDERDRFLKNYSPDDGKFTQVNYVKINKKVSGFVTGSDRGSLMIF